MRNIRTFAVWGAFLVIPVIWICAFAGENPPAKQIGVNEERGVYNMLSAAGRMPDGSPLSGDTIRYLMALPRSPLVDHRTMTIDPVIPWLYMADDLSAAAVMYNGGCYERNWRLW